MDFNVADEDLPEWVHEIVHNAITKNDVLDEAVTEATKKITKHGDFNSLVGVLVSRAIRRLVCSARDHRTQSIKRTTKSYGQGPKIDMHNSERMRHFHATVYQMSVAGKTLGMLLGEEIEDAANKERECGNGHLAKARLLGRLAPLVKPGKTVQEAVSVRKLTQLIRETAA